MSISKKELIKRIAKNRNYNDKIVEEIVDATLEEIYQCLKNEESVNLRNFGTFYIKNKGRTMQFKFNPSQKLKKLFGWSSNYKGEI